MAHAHLRPRRQADLVDNPERRQLGPVRRQQLPPLERRRCVSQLMLLTN